MYNDNHTPKDKNNKKKRGRQAIASVIAIVLIVTMILSLVVAIM